MRIVLPLTAAILVTCSMLSAQQSATVAALHPHPKTAFERLDSLPVTDISHIVVPDGADSVTMRAATYLQREIQLRTGFRCAIITQSTIETDSANHHHIMLGTWADPQLHDRIVDAMPRGEPVPPGQGYVLDVSRSRALLAGADSDGLFNGISTLVQLLQRSPVGSAFALRCAHVWDYPDYPIRWVFSQHNLRGANAIATLKKVQDTMAFYKLNGLQQNDFKYNLLESQPNYYFDSVRRFTANALATNTEIIPGVADIGYSEGILWHDPNLAEGFLAGAGYVIAGDTGRLIPDPRVSLPNGSFEGVGGNGKFTGWSFYDDGSATPDHAVYHGGSTSARCTNFTNGNAAGNSRFNLRLTCQPHRAYVMSAWVRTQDLQCDQVQLLALGVDGTGGTHSLTFTSFNIPTTTNGWRKVEVVFNTLEYSTVLLYAGVWGGRSGTIWWDDFEIRDAGLANILRRAGTPLHIYHLGPGTECHEGVDVQPIVDSVMLRGNGFYGPDNTAPTLRRIPTGELHNGDTVVVTWYHPITTIADVNGSGQVMVCPSEEKLYTILADQIARVDSLYHPNRFFLEHDEIRVMNRDSACLARNVSPATLLADNVRRTIGIVEATHPGASTFLWSDMFDSLHNAVNNYYLVNGDLTGVWDSIPRTATIVNWNFGRRDQSLAEFSRRGFTQITAPYYDEGGTSNMRAWRRSMTGKLGMKGMMYTTWSSDFSFLRPFAYYAWGAGPAIIHEPADTATMLPARIGTDTTGCFRVIVLPDPYDPADSITAVTLSLVTGEEAPETVDIPLQRQQGNVYVGCFDRIGWRGFSYRITARNTQGIERRTPNYDVRRMGQLGVRPDDADGAQLALEIAPNPATANATLRFMIGERGTWTMTLNDLLGRTVRSFVGEAMPGEQIHRIDLGGLPAGVYQCMVRTAHATSVRVLHVVR